MGVMHDLEVAWDELLEAFANPDAELVYFLDRETGEIFFVAADYEDEAFWREVRNNAERYLTIPGYDYDQERLLVYQFIRALPEGDLRSLLERNFDGRLPIGRLDEILSFYPDEQEQLEELRDAYLTDRVRRWLEEHDLLVEHIETASEG